MVDGIKRIMKDIKGLKIQGARRVAAATANAITLAAKRSKARTPAALMADLEKTANKLISLRSTEPMVRNTMKYFLAHMEKCKTVREMKSRADKVLKQYDKEFTDSFLKVTQFGSDLMWDGETVLTHCHSTTVNSILIHAHKHKKIKVYCTETRPLYQGHLTAKQLSDAGVDVTLIVDSAVGHFMKEVDMVIVGADSITSQGQLYNKIGTSTIATVAYDRRIPLYAAAQIYKFDPLTRWGKMTEIEMRPPKEVLARKIKGVKVMNPAFDITQPEYIRAYITSAGVIPPQAIEQVARRYAKL